MNFNDLKKQLGKFADKATEKTEEIAELATIKLKIARLSSALESEYLRLGKMTHKRLTSSNPGPALAEKISATVDKITDILDEIDKLKAEYEQKKQEAEARKKAKNSDEIDLSDDEINSDVMDSFVEAENGEDNKED